MTTTVQTPEKFNHNSIDSHCLITGISGSGKTRLARRVLEARLDAGQRAFVVTTDSRYTDCAAQDRTLALGTDLEALFHVDFESLIADKDLIVFDLSTYALPHQREAMEHCLGVIDQIMKPTTTIQTVGNILLIDYADPMLHIDSIDHLIITERRARKMGMIVLAIIGNQGLLEESSAMLCHDFPNRVILSTPAYRLLGLAAKLRVCVYEHGRWLEDCQRGEGVLITPNKDSRFSGL